MLKWLKNFGTGVSQATVSIVAINCWKQCVSQESGDHVPRYRDILFWQGVFVRFAQEWRKVQPSASDVLEGRCGLFLQFIHERIIENYSVYFTEAELEQIGEFVAVSIIRDFKEAILADAERASLVIDLLPREWCDTAGLDPEKFDDWYFKMTGKERVRRG